MRNLIILLVFCSSILYASGRTVVGDYHVGFGYTHVGNDFADYDGLGVAINYPTNEYFDLGGGASVGRLSVQDEDALQWDLNIKGKLHKKFELEGSFLKSVDPFIGAGVGITVIQQFYWGYTGSDYSYDYYEVMSTADNFFPWVISLGAELKFGEKFSLVPSIATGGAFNLDVDSTFSYGLSANIFFNDSWSATVGFGQNPDLDSTSFGIAVNMHR